MTISHNRTHSRYGAILCMLVAILLCAPSMSHAAVTITTDLAEWESMVSDIEVLVTTADNIAKAVEVDSAPGDNEALGSHLSFPPDIMLDNETKLTRGFQIFNEQVIGEDPDGNPVYADFVFNNFTDEDWQDALSVGDHSVNHSDDDWSLRLRGGATMTAFGVEIRNSRNLEAETITLYLMAQDKVVEIIELNDVPNDPNFLFLGIVTDTPFDRVFFDENADTDDIAIADFRFASTRMETQICSRLGDNPRPYIRDLDIFKFKGEMGEKVAVYLDKDPEGEHKGERATLILKGRCIKYCSLSADRTTTDYKITAVAPELADDVAVIQRDYTSTCLIRVDRGALPNEVSAELPADGVYTVIVAEQREFRRRLLTRPDIYTPPFKGDYCVSMESSGDASESFTPTRWVE